ncbi:MAG: MarR family transcriptional regulator [Desulfomonile tiedjei]|uniref:MarR family transcriptional regulator n=1 Tax=Desulfomonile tiedjei TaxID=2358 RepID=A0A9D6V4W0_9BACT|nr:MarR family transcriptional regulator [Desulfomonile tiedjei]
MPKDQLSTDMILDEKVMIFIVMASEMFKKKSSAILRQYGLTFPHYNVLKYLTACKEGQDSVGNISKHMLVTGANVTGLAKRMQKAGLIERKNDKKDERLTVLQITPMALKTLDEIRNIQEQHVGEYLQVYAREQKEEVLSVLKHIVRKGKQLAGSKY